ncbi:recombinase family protein [Micromonospora fulviviridis]|uniref:Recombinase family protein n=1 Tax=Micromonospora fulviviridis TaxID=47860 RepID=A0ABV2VW49_9ACTN
MAAAPALAPAEGDLLAPTPLAGVLVGYGRVSTREQNLARQQAALTAAGCAKCFFDKASGKNTDRPELARMFDYIRPGDALTVVSLDRLGRSLEDLIGIVGQLKRQGVGFLSLHEKLDTTTAGGMFVFHVFAALAEFIRTIIVANTNEGLAAARARGQRLGRPPVMTPEKVAYALQLLAEPDRSMSSIAKLLNISRSTLYKALPELLPVEQARQRLDMPIAALPGLPPGAGDTGHVRGLAVPRSGRAVTTAAGGLATTTEGADRGTPQDAV